MKVKELIIALLSENMEEEVIIRIHDDIATVDGIALLSGAENNGYCGLSTDIEMVRK